MPSLQSQMKGIQGHVIVEQKKIQTQFLSDLNDIRYRLTPIRVGGMNMGDACIFKPIWQHSSFYGRKNLLEYKAQTLPSRKPKDCTPQYITRKADTPAT
jgi:hypothetical protein